MGVLLVIHECVLFKRISSAVFALACSEREYNTTGLMLANGDLMCLMCENRFAWTSKQSEEGRGHSRKFRDF